MTSTREPFHAKLGFDRDGHMYTVDRMARTWAKWSVDAQLETGRVEPGHHFVHPSLGLVTVKIPRGDCVDRPRGAGADGDVATILTGTNRISVRVPGLCGVATDWRGYVHLLAMGRTLEVHQYDLDTNQMVKLSPALSARASVLAAEKVGRGVVVLGIAAGRLLRTYNGIVEEWEAPGPVLDATLHNGDVYAMVDAGPEVHLHIWRANGSLEEPRGIPQPYAGPFELGGAVCFVVEGEIYAV